MQAGIVVKECLPSLYDVQLVFAVDAVRDSKRIIYLPDTAENTHLHDCDPAPAVLRAERLVRERFGLCGAHNLLDLLAKGSLPRFDAYDEVYGFAYAVSVLEPLLRSDVIRELGDGEFDDAARKALLEVNDQLAQVRPDDVVLGGQRRMLCVLNDDRSYKNRPLEWLCVAEQKSSRR